MSSRYLATVRRVTFDSFRLEPGCYLIVGEGMTRILVLDHFLTFRFRISKGITPPLGPCNRLREEVAQFENPLRRMDILIRHRAAHC